jgi:hypothetical protein
VLGSYSFSEAGFSESNVKASNGELLGLILSIQQESPRTIDVLTSSDRVFSVQRKQEVVLPIKKDIKE